MNIKLFCLVTKTRKEGNFLYVPIVGIVVTTSPSLSLYKIVVFPAASSPTVKETYTKTMIELS